MAVPQLEVLLPVHNEGTSLEKTLREIYEELSRVTQTGFIICEDGSQDNTRDILGRLSREIPLRLNLCDDRRGYGRAVRDGMEMLESEYLLCLDSDGQCDPRDFAQFWVARNDADVLIGRRMNRADTVVRRTCSRLFFLIYQAAFRVPVHDPSCPFVLMRRPIARRLSKELGAMQQGFWWEFVIRAHRHGYRIKELPVHHRRRSAGATQVYRWKTMPGIFFRHVAAIFQILLETRGGPKQAS